MTLVIIKNTSQIDDVLKCLNCKYLVFNSFEKIMLPRDCKGIIICGGTEHVYNCDWNKNIANIQSIVQGRSCPILGICYGMQVIAHVFGGEVQKLPFALNGLHPIDFDKSSPLFVGLNSKDASFSNEDIVSRVPIGFKIISYISNTKKTIGFQNKKNNIYGVQFHPERLNSTKVILRNFINICKINITINMKDVVISKLNDMYNIEKGNGQPFKAKAYKKVIEQLRLIPEINTIDDISKVTGIGDGIKKKIQQIFDNGEIEGIQKQDVEKTKVIDELTKIHGIGAIKASELYVTHNIKNIEDLENNKQLLNDKQLLGLKYYKDIEKRIPRREMEKHEIVLFKSMAKLNISSLKYEIAGSYRRGNNDSGDIDLIISANNEKDVLSKIVKMLKEINYIRDDFAFGDKKYMGVCCLPRHKSIRRIDIMFTEPTQYPFALLYFTGSQNFNIGMRNIAISKGYSLNEYGLTKNGNKISNIFLNEKDVFDFLDMKWVDPKNR